MRGVLVALVGLTTGCDVVFDLGGRTEPDATTMTNDTPPPDSFEACPDADAGYIPVIGTPGDSVYKLFLNNPNDRPWRFAHDDCLNDSETGVTHLVVFDNVTEIDVLRELIMQNFPPSTAWSAWAGYARDTGSDEFTFYAVTGDPVPYPSAMWDPAEPNNGSGSGREETTLWFASYTNLIDGPYDYPIPNWICECDGRRETRTFMLAP